MAIKPIFVDGFDVIDIFSGPGAEIKYDSLSVQGFGLQTTGFGSVGSAIKTSGTRALIKDVDPSLDTFLISFNYLFTTQAAGASGGDWPFMVGNWPGGMAGNSNFPIALAAVGTSTLTWQLWVDCNLVFFAPNGIYSGRSVSDPGNVKTVAWTDTAPLTINQWYSIQLKYTISTKHIELYIDGALKFSGSFTSSGPFTQLMWRTNGNTALGYQQLDNVVALSADNPTDTWSIFPLVTSVTMNANGTNNWTRNTNAFGSNNYNVINEFDGDGSGRADPDGNTSYVASGGLTEESYFSNVSGLTGVGYIFLNATWIPSAGTQGLKGAFAGSPLEPEYTQVFGTQNEIVNPITGSYYKTTQWLRVGNGSGNWGVIQTSGAAGVQMTNFYLEALHIPAAVIISVTCPLVGTGEEGIVYPGGSIVGSGGTGPYTYAISSGSLPPGLTLNTSTGAITGTPTTAGTYPYGAQATDSLGNVGTSPCSFTITSSSLAPACPVSGAAILGVAYSGTLTVTGGTAPYVWVLVTGPLPPGITLTGSGIVSGTPTATGTYPYQVKVVDANNVTAFVTCTITVRTPSGGCQKYSLLSGTPGQPPPIE